jgi:uncharacterized protein (DUF983 family)
VLVVADVMINPPPSTVSTKFARAMRLRCPRCGIGRVMQWWLKMNDECSGCGLGFNRGEDEDFWIGAYVFNLVAGETTAILIPVIWMIATAPNQPWTAIEILAAALAVVMPFAFFPFSRTLWLAWDLSFRPSEPGDNVARVNKQQ